MRYTQDEPVLRYPCTILKVKRRMGDMKLRRYTSITITSIYAVVIPIFLWHRCYPVNYAIVYVNLSDGIVFLKVVQSQMRSCLEYCVALLLKYLQCFD